MRILFWHVHGSWATAFVQGSHDYLVPVTPDRGADGVGRARTWDWPPNVVELPPADLRDADIDLIVLQRPHEVDLAERWTGRRAGRDVAAAYVEHNTPKGEVPLTRHPLADQREIPVVHVTHFNRLIWDCGSAPTDVIEHGIVDPGHHYSGDLAHAAVVVNEPVRRGRVVGTDLLPGLAEVAPLDVFGMRVHELHAELAIPDDQLTTYEDLSSQAEMHQELARRRVYVHTSRWTSLGLSLLEAMHLGMPVVVVAATEAPLAVPPQAGVVTASPEELAAGVRRFLDDHVQARAVGTAAREAALSRYGLARFLADWDARIAAWTSGPL